MAEPLSHEGKSFLRNKKKCLPGFVLKLERLVLLGIGSYVAARQSCAVQQILQQIRIGEANPYRALSRALSLMRRYSRLVPCGFHRPRLVADSIAAPAQNALWLGYHRDFSDTPTPGGNDMSRSPVRF